VIVTTLLDAKTYAPRRWRPVPPAWHAELDLRSLKTDMRMEMLRTKTRRWFARSGDPPAGVQPDRGLMAEAARAARVKPRCSASRVVAHGRAFEQVHLYDPARIEADLRGLLELLGEKRVVDRPDRYEPRA